MKTKQLNIRINIRTVLCALALLCVFAATGCESARKVGRDPLLGQTRLAPPQTEPRSVYVDRQNPVESGVVPGAEFAAGPQTHQTNYPNFDPMEIQAESYLTRFSYDKILPLDTPLRKTPERTLSPYEQNRRALLKEFESSGPSRPAAAVQSVPANTAPALIPSPSSRAVGRDAGPRLERPFGEIPSDLPPAPAVLPPMKPAPRGDLELEPGVWNFDLLPE